MQSLCCAQIYAAQMVLDCVRGYNAVAELVLVLPAAAAEAQQPAGPAAHSAYAATALRAEQLPLMLACDWREGLPCVRSVDFEAGVLCCRLAPHTLCGLMLHCRVRPASEAWPQCSCDTV